MKIDLLLCEADRKRFNAPEALMLDTERVQDTPGGMLVRWERECGYAIERALIEILGSSTPPAGAVMVCVWLARKQMGEAGGGLDDEGHPEPYSALAELRTLRTGTRVHAEEAGDVDPPDSSPAR